MEKLCLFCKQFYFRSGDHGYSEWTPGWDASVGCDKDIFKVDLYMDNTESYRQKLLNAETCEYYENYKDN